jgi:hypothetical protein
LEEIMNPSTLIDRFWKYTQKASNEECWLWTGAIMKRGGYGQINEKGKLHKAHRLSFEIHKGDIPAKKLICHKCNNRLCVNPDHLYAGDYLTNTRDKMVAGTQYKLAILKGENCFASKITWEDVLLIRSSPLSCYKLGEKYGVSAAAISNIKRGKTWKTRN